MKRNLLLYTRDFPFGKGEVSFILPELTELHGIFDITIVSKNMTDAQTTALPEDIRVLRIPVRTERCLFNLLKSFADRLLWREIAGLIRTGRFTFMRALSAYKEMTAANQFFSKLRRLGVIRKKDGQIHYSYWYDQTVIGLCRHKRQLGDGRIATRMHRCDLYEFNEPKYLPFRTCLSQLLDACIFVSKEGMNYYRHHYGIPESQRHRVFYLGVPNDAGPQDYSTFNGTVRIVSCSFISPVKRIEKIIDVIAQISRYHVSWTHIGGGALEKEIRAYAAKVFENRPQISWNFTGFLTTRQIYDLYRREPFDLFLNLSESEGLPVTFMEAMSFGIPVLSCITGGVGEILDERNSVTVGITDSSGDIAASIVRFVEQDSVTIARYRENAYLTWKEKFNSKKNFSLFARYLETI